MTGNIRVAPDGTSFTWKCPRCGFGHYGYIGDEPVSGWDNPCWVNSGTLEAPTLQPSLGCHGLKNGSCDGHFFCRDGELVPA